MPDDLRPQIQPIYDIVEALGIKIFVVDNVEADDVIGTLAKQAEDGIRDIRPSRGLGDVYKRQDFHWR